MFEIIKTIVGLTVLSFTLTYGLYYLGAAIVGFGHAMTSIYAYAYGMKDWEW